MTIRLVRPNARYAGLDLSPPPPTGYLHLAAAVEPTMGPTPLPRQSARKRKLIHDLKAMAERLTHHDAVTKATVYTAALIPPPGRGAPPADSPRPRYDIACLIETTAVTALEGVQSGPAYQQLYQTLTVADPNTLAMAACCVRVIADVDKSRQGLFLFNYFTASDKEVALELWEHLAAWYATETGMNNSTLLDPLTDTGYVFVNHARWDRHLASFMAAQFAKPSFRNYVIENLRANHVASTPILFHLA
jgi:hypothetical protein